MATATKPRRHSASKSSKAKPSVRRAEHEVYRVVISEPGKAERHGPVLRSEEVDAFLTGFNRLSKSTHISARVEPVNVAPINALTASDIYTEHTKLVFAIEYNDDGSLALAELVKVCDEPEEACTYAEAMQDAQTWEFAGRNPVFIVGLPAALRAARKGGN